MEKKCPRCEAVFECNLEQHCWCFDLPHIPVRPGPQGCWCPDCLRQEIGAVQARVQSKPPEPNG